MAAIADVELKRRVLAILEDVWVAVVRANPRGPQHYSDPEKLVVAIDASAMSMFRATVVLLREDLTQEAMAIGRTLLESAVTLAYFHANSERLDELTLRYDRDRIIEERDLGAATASHYADVVEWPTDPNVELARVDATLAAIGAPTQRLPNVARMAESIGQPRLVWLYKLLSSSVHPSRFALGYRMQRTPAGDYAVSARAPVTTMLLPAKTACEHVTAAHVAAADLLGWDGVQALIEHRKAMHATWELLHADHEAQSAG